MKHELPAVRTSAAEKELERFRTRYRAMLRRAESISLSILVWGPDPKRDSPVSRKRKEIRDELIRLGHNAMFSEDIPKEEFKISEKSKEFAEALSSDLIVILVEDSPGALAEAHDFCNHPDIAPKVFVLIPRRYRKGYSGRGAIKDLDDAHSGVFWYGDEDLSRCRLCSRVLKRAQALRNIRLRAGFMS